MLDEIIKKNNNKISYYRAKGEIFNLNNKSEDNLYDFCVKKNYINCLTYV